MLGIEYKKNIMNNIIDVSNLHFGSMSEDLCFKLILNTGFQKDLKKNNYKNIIQLCAIVNCDKNNITYYVENLFTGDIKEFDNYRQALGEFFLSS